MKITIEVNKKNFEKLMAQYENGSKEERRKKAIAYCQSVIRDVAFAGL